MEQLCIILKDTLCQNITEVKKMSEPKDMYQCQTVNCGCIYDPERGDRRGKIPKGIRFEETPVDWC